ncbi:hypothetical protein L914_17521 [Phytophthora nicotianae]|uniref:Uncharacterized protein n=2 Tax=Phytophthora nicotianae TaxID=4792 RepID=V9E1X2_PHYNI|nr:hypothetical protein F443_20214 [Phytophthora nicotianae P1569]ETM35597.1 hypothetical protein L914_17521 [Phytophthora nicotianae]
MQAMAVATKVDQICPGKLDKNMKNQERRRHLHRPQFSGDYACALTAFYDMKAKCRSCIEDRKWLELD